MQTRLTQQRNVISGTFFHANHLAWYWRNWI